MNELSTKIYKFNFKFILDNYLDRRLWKKEWTIFEYDNTKVLVRIKEINVEQGYVSMKVYLQNAVNYWNYNTFYIYFIKDHYNELVLTQELISAVMGCFWTKECGLATEEEGYDYAQQVDVNNREMLRQIANDFLDEQNISHKEIREAYIDKYVSDHDTNYTGDYVNSRKYNIIPALYLAYASYMGDEKRFEDIKTQSGLSKTKAKNLKVKLDEFVARLESEELIVEMKESLEVL